jgi:hypothetical protein
MATETSSINKLSGETLQTVSALQVLQHYLKQNGYKPIKEDAELEKEHNGNLLLVSRHGRKELIDVRGLSAFSAVLEPEEEHASIADHLLHSMQSLAEAFLYSFIHVGRYFKGEKVLSSLALPDTERYRKILKNLGDYFTGNNLDFKIYLVAEDGEVQERNLNEKKNKAAVPEEVMKNRKALRS